MVIPCVWLGALVDTLPPVVAFAPAVFLLTSSLSIRMLGTSGLRLAGSLKAKDIEQARIDLGSLCSRDAAALSESQLAAGAIESVAENTTDSVVAPVFYFVLFGLPGALAYRAVNTLDAMYGYRDRYEWFGKFIARADDVLNFIPARLAALLMLGAGQLLDFKGQDAIATWKADGDKTSSPNAGQTMSIMAGLLSIKLEKSGGIHPWG